MLKIIDSNKVRKHRLSRSQCYTCKYNCFLYNLDNETNFFRFSIHLFDLYIENQSICYYSISVA